MGAFMSRPFIGILMIAIGNGMRTVEVRGVLAQGLYLIQRRQEKI